jgi:site-specific recombinase XerD
MSDTPHDQPPTLEIEIQDFLLDRQIRKLSPKTIRWHKACLAKWQVFCVLSDVAATEQVTPKLLRLFLVHLETKGHNEGGISHIYRSVKTFLRWYEDEYEPPTWKSPTRKVKVKAPSSAPLDPLSIDDFNAMLAACERKTLAGERDRAVLYMFLDSGMRHQELTDLLVGDVNLANGEVTIRKGKGGKARTVFIGATTRRALLHYLRYRGPLPPSAPLWIGKGNRRLNKDGIRQIVRRRAADAGIPEPGLHAFRRAFAVNSLRNGMSIVTLQRLLGHSTLAIINRYLKLVTDDLRVAHAEFGVVDNLGGRGARGPPKP